MGLGIPANAKNLKANHSKVRKGIAFSKVIDSRTKIENGREYYYHATKGWKSRRM